MAWRFDQAAFEGRIRENRERQEREDLAAMDAEDRRHGVCYFIGCDEGLVKIGFTANLPQRFNRIKSSSPYKLKILAVANGGRAREAHYHQKFADHCFSGEWFERCPEIEAEIRRLRSRCGQEEGV